MSGQIAALPDQERSTQLRPVHTGQVISIEIPEAQPLVPDAIYSAICTGYEVAEVFKRFRVFFHFRVVQGPYTGTILFRAYPVNGHRIVGKGPGSGIRYKLHRRAHLFQMLSRVLGLTANAKAHRVWPRELVTKLCEIQTRTVSHDSRQKALADGERYSVVADVLSIVAG